MRALLQLDSTENLHKRQQYESHLSDIFTGDNWRREIVEGNNAMGKGLYFTAHDRYKTSLFIAKKIFQAHQSYDNVPDHLIPAIVVSYLNLCELLNKQNKVTARKGYLCAAFDYLVFQLQFSNLCSDLKEQVRRGLDKVFIEIIQVGDKDIITMKKQSLMKM